MRLLFPIFRAGSIPNLDAIQQDKVGNQVKNGRSPMTAPRPQRSCFANPNFDTLEPYFLKQFPHFFYYYYFLAAKNVTSSSIDDLIDLKLSKGMANIEKIKACKGNSSCVNPSVDDQFNISSFDDPLKNSTTGKIDFLTTSKTAEVTK